MKRWVIIIAGALIVISTIIFLTSQNKPAPSTNPNTYLYFWSLTCPHCKNVADFLDKWAYKDKLLLDKKEVSEDRGNSALFLTKSNDCGIAKENAGVPLLVTPEGKCFTGDTPVIDYFKSLFPESTQSATISGVPNQ
jgi:thiol-disulfide isomerase/thioredoxin